MTEQLRNVMDQAAASLAGSATFRTLVGASSHASALAKIYFRDLPQPGGEDGVFTLEEMESYRPYGLIWVPFGSYSVRYIATGCYAPRGKVMLRIVRPVPSAESMSRDDADEAWEDIVAAIMDEMAALCGDSSTAYQYLDFEEIRIHAGPGRTRDDRWPAQGDEQGVDLEILWGDEGR